MTELILAIIALLSVAGAWTTWRRNPLYSTRSALHSLAIILLAIVGLVATIIASVNFIEGKSEMVAGITLGAVVLFGAFGLIFVIQTFATPKEAQLHTALPSSAKLVNVHRRKVYKAAKITAMVAACFGLLGWILPGNFESRYKPKEWATITGTFNDLERRDNITLVNHLDHIRSLSFGAVLMPSPRYGLDLSYGYVDVFSRTTFMLRGNPRSNWDRSRRCSRRLRHQ